ncbi:MAG: oxidoreductase [Alphaproteobacteria bacterium]|nr:oxidoreductase [Alphaproteobacteria bacterium]
MTSIFALAVLAAPTALLLASLVATSDPGIRPRKALFAARFASLGALLMAVAAALATAFAGAGTSPLIGWAEIGLSIRLDALSATMFLLVSFVGAIVVQFSRSYLDGDPRQGLFLGRLCATLAAVTLLVLSGNVIQLVLAWIATSLALHQLLVFYADRRKAVVAANKKAFAARLGDACLIGAVALMAMAAGTTDIGTILTMAGSLSEAPAEWPLAAFLIVFAALLKSAQFPFHGWLPEVMETPTPVSALLHAGIINAGGFLVIRFADVMMLSAGSLHVLAIVGGFTALFGAVVMLTQTSVKVSLAWSTVAQMGFMLLQCGLGLFSLAVLHIVAHSLYKAHAFLSSGSVVELARASWVPVKSGPKIAEAGLGLAVALGLYAGVGLVFGIAADTPVQVLALGAILVMGLTLMIAQGLVGQGSVGQGSVGQGSVGQGSVGQGSVVNMDRRTLGRVAAAAAGISVAYFTLHAGSVALFASLLPSAPAAGPVALAVIALALLSFGLVTVLQLVEPWRADNRLWRAARVHLANGLYVNTLFDRMAEAYRAAPTKTAKSAD